jgi:hypothetical protein
MHMMLLLLQLLEALVHNANGFQVSNQLIIMTLLQSTMILNMQLNSALGSETDITLLPMLTTSARINHKMFATMLLIQIAYGMILSTHQLLKR